MAFPVDILTNVDHESLELAAEEYMSQLHCRKPEYLSLPDSSPIEIRNVSFLPLYGAETKWKLLALLSPDDYTTIVGLYLLDRWWGVKDVLKTAEPSRTGLIKVSTLGERIVLYVLNRIVLRNEKSKEDISFLCHCEHETAKILWKDGEAIGFYSLKPKGSLCRIFLTQCYQLPVMDTVFVRNCHRGKGHGVKMLEDFVSSFRKEDIGLKFPLSEAMYKVCEKYFSVNPADKELLWEVEKIGSPFQRTLIANRLQKLKIKAEKDQVVTKLNFEEDVATSPMEIEITKIQETTEYTVEIVEKAITDITKEADDIPVTRRGRSSNLKRRGIKENSEERLSKNIIRVEDIEAGVESPIEVSNLDNRFSVKESEAVLRSTTGTITATVMNITELTGVQTEEEQRIERHIITAISEKTSHHHLTSAKDIKSQRDREEESEMVSKEQTVKLQETTICSIDQEQVQSVVDIEIVKMGTGTEEEQNQNLQNNKEAGEDQMKQMLTEPEEEKAETAEALINTEALKEVTEQAEIHAKTTEQEQTHWDMEKTVEKERSEDEILEDCGMENRNDSMVTEKCEAKDPVQFVKVKDQREIEGHFVDPVTEVLCTEEHLSEVEQTQTKKNKDKVIEKSKEEKLFLDEEEKVLTRSKLPQKRPSSLTPSRSSKRLRHEPAETDLQTKKFVKTTQQRYKHHSKTVMQKDINQPIPEPEYNISDVTEKNMTDATVEEYKGNDKLTVETVATMNIEIAQVKETVDVVPEDSELQRVEIHKGEEPQQSSVDAAEVQDLMHEETVENSTVTMSEASVVLVDLHKLSSKEVGDKHGEIDNAQQEETMRTEEQDITLDNKTMEITAFTTTTAQYIVAADVNVTAEQSTPYKEGEPELENTDVVLLVDTADEKTESEQELQKSTETDDSERGYQITEATNKDTPLVEAEPDEEADKEQGTSGIKLQKATVVLQDFNQLSKNTNKESETPDVLTLSQTEQQPELNEADKSEQELCNLPSKVNEKQEKLQTQEETEKISEAEKMEEENTNEERNKLDKQDMAFEEQKPTEVPSEDEEASSLTQDKSVEENLEEQALVSTERSLRQRTIQVQSVQKRKSRSVQKQQVEDFEDKTEKVKITVKGVKKIHKEGVKIDYKDTASQKSTVDATEKVTPEAELEAGKAAEEINKTNIPIIIVETSMETLDEMQNMNVVETPPVKPNTSELIKGEDIADKKETPQIEENVQFEEAKPEEEGSSVLQLQKATVVLVDLNKRSQNTEGESDTLEGLPQTEGNLELDQSVNSEQADTEKTQKEEKMEERIAIEDQNELDKQEFTCEGQKPTEDLEGQNDAKERETVEECSIVTSGRHQKGSMAEKTPKVQEAENNEDVALQEQEAHSDVEITGLVQEVPETVQEILEEEAAVSTERSLRRRTIQVQAAPKRKSRRVQKQQVDDFEEKTDSMTGKGVEEINKQGAEIDDKEETLEKSTIEAVEDVITLEAEPEECVAEQVVKEINKLEKEESHLAEDKYTDEEAPEEGEDDLKQQENEQLVKNMKEKVETEKHTETDPVVSKEKPQVVERTTIYAKDVFQVKMTETSQSDYEGVTRRSLRLSSKPVTSTLQTRKYTRLHKTDLKPVKGSNMNINEHGETSTTSEKAVEVCIPIITVETSLEGLNETENINVEETPAVEPESSELQMVVEINDTVETPQIVEDVPSDEAEPEEEVEEDDSSTVIQLQKATVVLVDLNKLSQNTEGESDTLEVLLQTEGNLDLDQPVNSENQLCSLTSEEEEQQEVVHQEEDTKKTHEEDKMEEGNANEDQNEPNKQDFAFEGQKLTENLQGQDDAIETETVEDYSDVTSEEHQTDGDVEITGLVHEVQETVQEILEEEAAVSTERSLRRRTIQVQATPKRKSRRVQKQQVETFEEITVPIPGKGVEDVHKGGAEIHDKVETLQSSIVQTCLESLEEMSSSNVENTADVDAKHSLQMGLEVDYQEQEFQIVVDSEEISPVEAEPDEEVEKEEGTPVIKLQKATVVLEQSTDKENETPDVLTLSQTEQQPELNEADKGEEELCNLPPEVYEKQEKYQIQEKEKMEEENTEQNKLDKQGGTFEEQKTTEVQSENEGASSLTQEKSVEENLKEEALVSTERSLRRRTIKVQSVQKRKSSRVQKQQVEDFEDETGKVAKTGKGVEEMHECCEKIDHKPTVDASEEEIPYVQAEPDHDVPVKVVEKIGEMENKEIDLGNEVASEMRKEGKEKESSETENPTEVDEVSLISKKQACIIEETIQVVEEVPQIESSETEETENKSERFTQRSLRIGKQSVTSTQKTRKSARLHTAEMGLVKEAMSRNEDTSSTIVDATNVCVAIITEDTNVENLNEDGDLHSLSRKEETASDEQNADIKNNKGMVDDALPERSTDKQEDETKSSMKTPENESEMEMDKSQRVVEEAIQEKEEKNEPPPENTQDTAQQQVESQEDNVENTQMNEFETPAVLGKVALERSDQETLFITRRSLRSRTVTVQATPRRKSKRLPRQDMESEKETKDNICGDENDSAFLQSADDLNIHILTENDELNPTKESTAELENLEKIDQKEFVILNIKEVEETEANPDSLEERNQIPPEVVESNNTSLENTEQSKTQEENLEKDDVQEHEEEKDKTLHESENEPSDLEETTTKRRSLRKRTTVKAAAPRTSKRLRKQEQDKASEQIKEAEFGETESVEVTRVDVGKEILQEAQKNAERLRSEFKILEDTERVAGESQEEQKENRENAIQTDGDCEDEIKKAEGTGEVVEVVVEQHVETEEQNLESNECFTLELEAEETSDQEVDRESNLAMEAPKEIISKKPEEGEENISDDDEEEEALVTEKHGLQRSSATASTRRKSTRLQGHESPNYFEKDESDSEESEVQQTAKKRYKRKRKAITDSTPSRRSKRHGRAKMV